MKSRNILKIGFLFMYAVGIVALYMSFENWVVFVQGSPLNPRPTPLALPPPVAVHDTTATPEVFENGYRLQLHSVAMAFVSYVGRSDEVYTDQLLFTRTFVVPPNSNLGPASLFLSTEHMPDTTLIDWELVIAFPWPTDALTRPITYPIQWDLEFYSAPPPNMDSAGAELEIISYVPDKPRYCIIYQDGHVTLTSLDPLMGEFQFFCQFDSTDYAQVSGRFWE